MRKKVDLSLVDFSDKMSGYKVSSRFGKGDLFVVVVDVVGRRKETESFVCDKTGDSPTDKTGWRVCGIGLGG